MRARQVARCYEGRYGDRAGWIVSGASDLFFGDFKFNGEVVEITLSSRSGFAEIFSFSYVRSFVFFKETDFYQSISSYVKGPVLKSDGTTSRVFRIREGAVSSRYQTEELAREGVMYFGVWTPDECFEVSCFEVPTVR